jgi:hypothetical protein
MEETRMNRSLPWRLLLTLAAILPLACGAREPEGETAVPPLPESAARTASTTIAGTCPWIDPADAGAAVGAPIEVRAGDDNSSCALVADAQEARYLVKLWQGTAGFPALAAMAGMEPITGVGERAVWNEGIGTLDLVAGEHHLAITFEDQNIPPRLPNAGQQDEVIALAQAILAALPR